jgi:hypothetical protein
VRCPVATRLSPVRGPWVSPAWGSALRSNAAGQLRRRSVGRQRHLQRAQERRGNVGRGAGGRGVGHAWG